ncbi:SIMPL domain-containing protein [Acidisoma sp. S159]|jgi:predicted secreted protein|uniref:SIMPL domain-containing protein n=1 Tax=Acidisoma sp. S159 TaxID=1747225 RepID=UPI00131B7076|nr:SIMPL domain-containing protein [Acidisoma sp. S159]
MRLRDAAFALAFLAAPAAVAHADTMLELSAAGAVEAKPDELRAALTASAAAANAAAAQSQVNDAVTRALAAAKTAPAVTASTDAYSVWHETDPKDVWRASQGVALRSKDGGALLGLVGTLQAQGLAVNDLGWQLTTEARDAAYAQAMAKAIAALEVRGRVVARLLHLTFIGFQRMSVGEDGGSARPMPMMRMMATAAPSGPPNAQADSQTVTATVSGTARLITGE